jgi:uncharacterized membrane protein
VSAGGIAVKENVGRLDQIVRGVVGAGAVALALSQLRKHPILGALGIVAGAMVTETAVTRVCPLNTALGLDTRSTQEQMRDFRTEINEESERITSTYGQPIVIDEITHS